MTQTAYARADETFEALVSGAETAAYETPAQLIQSAGLSASTGYRHVAALEAEGLVRRDAAGTYFTGLTAIRTGLRGFGMGRLAPIAQPVLLQLRQATQHTAFLAIVQDMDLLIGPHSLGRETRNARLERVYGFEAIPELAKGEAREMGLRYFDDGIARRISTLMTPIDSTPSMVVALGLVLNPSRVTPDALSQALVQAHDQIATALEGA